MKYCRNCGAQMEDEAAFCPKCGAAAADAQGTGEENTPVSESSTAGETTALPPAETKKKKSHRKLLLIPIAAAAVLVLLVLIGFLGGEPADQKVVYEGIEFHVPAKWKLSEDTSSDAGLYFYTDNSKTSGEMLCMTAVPDVSSILSLFGADYLADWLTEYVQESTGGDTVNAQKLTTAGYETYLFDVTGVDTDAEGDSVQGGYRMAYIINTDKSEMILVYAAGLSVGEDDQKVLSDIDDILGNAVATTAANSY